VPVKARNAQTTRQALPDCPGARAGRGPLDVADPARLVSRGRAEVSGFAGLARGDRAEHAVGSPEGHARERDRRAPVLFRAPAPRRVPLDQEGERPAAGAEGPQELGRGACALTVARAMP